jgi:hypothetical protein
MSKKLNKRKKYLHETKMYIMKQHKIFGMENKKLEWNLGEIFCVIKADKGFSFNKRSEIDSNCRHIPNLIPKPTARSAVRGY